MTSIVEFKVIDKVILLPEYGINQTKFNKIMLPQEVGGCPKTMLSW
jgi:hypothetical protein